MLRLSIFFFCLPLLFSFSSKTDNPDELLGRWLSSKKRNQVQIYKHGNHYHGRLVWMLEPNDAANHPKTDKLNPNAALRHRPLLNMVIVNNLQYKGGNVWGGGQIYNPEDGKTYGCEVTLRDHNTIEIHGYMMGMKFLGKTITWTRVP